MMSRKLGVTESWIVIIYTEEIEVIVQRLLTHDETENRSKLVKSECQGTKSKHAFMVKVFGNGRSNALQQPQVGSIRSGGFWHFIPVLSQFLFM